MGDAFCESCGATLAPGPSTAASPPSTATTDPTAGAGAAGPVGAAGLCARCGGSVDGDGFCTSCGHRRPPDDHVEVDLGPVAAVSDRGRRHHRNEDAVAVIRNGARAAAVVCDGVSSTANPDRAASAAATAAAAVLRGAVESAADADAPLVLRRAVEAARHAAASVPVTETGASPAAPSTTLAAVLVGPGTVAVASVGDSRVYWLAPGHAELVTVDDSWAETAIRAGADPAVAYSSPQAHTITRWLGADSDDSPPPVTVLRVDCDGMIVVCSDGLWNYFEAAGALATVVDEVRGATPVEIARHLISAALAAGGHDNVTVVIVLAGPAGVPRPASTDTDTDTDTEG